MRGVRTSYSDIVLFAVALCSWRWSKPSAEESCPFVGLTASPVLFAECSGAQSKVWKVLHGGVGVCVVSGVAQIRICRCIPENRGISKACRLSSDDRSFHNTPASTYSVSRHSLLSSCHHLLLDAMSARC